MYRAVQAGGGRADPREHHGVWADAACTRARNWRAAGVDIVLYCCCGVPGDECGGAAACTKRSARRARSEERVDADADARGAV